MNPPKNETKWKTFIENDKIKFVITSKINDRSVYYLYKVENQKLIKISKSKDPFELERLID